MVHLTIASEVNALPDDQKDGVAGERCTNWLIDWDKEIITYTFIDSSVLVLSIW